jgi:peptidoglycan lytic transglycosylase B
MARLRGLLALLLLLATGLSMAPAVAQDDAAAKPASFDAFLLELWPEAQAQGITRDTFDLAFSGLTPDPRVIAATRRQPEYGKPFGAYVDSIATRGRIESGLRHAKKWSAILAAVETRFGVDQWIIMATWGIETSFGEYKDRWDVFRSLATLAQARYRDPYFRKELIVALRILQERYIARDKMMSSWAGAMGQPQFMPSNYFDYAVTYSGGGQPDIWTNIPDVIASIGNYLHKDGWTPGLPWGFEVVVPNDYDYRRSTRGSFQEWAALGLRRPDNQAFPPDGDGILFFPAGAPAPAFLVTRNFDVIKRYNDSDVYALAVGHLADRLRGNGPIRAAWPPDDRQLSRDERIALQRKLSELGYDVRDFEGHFDFDLRDAIRKEQIRFDMRPDGHPTLALLQRLGIDAGKP